MKKIDIYIMFKSILIVNNKEKRYTEWFLLRSTQYAISTYPARTSFGMKKNVKSDEENPFHSMYVRRPGKIKLSIKK